MSRPEHDLRNGDAADVCLDVELRLFPHALGPPERARDGDAGVDLCTTVDAVLAPGERVLVGTGIGVALPRGHVGLVHPRSGLASRRGLAVLNSPGTIDAGYRGEIMVCLVNHDRHEVIELSRGDRIAQLLVQRVETIRFRVVDELGWTERGSSGHGSSGGHTSLADARTVAGPEPHTVRPVDAGGR